MFTVEEMALTIPVRISPDGINITYKGQEMQLLGNKSSCTVFGFI